MKNKNSKTGFTLIETLVAVTILSFAIVGPMTLSINSIGTASISRDKLTAFYLGQEAIEYVRNVRDTNLILSGAGGWLGGLIEKCANQGCYIDVINNTVAVCETACSDKLWLNEANYSYTKSGKETVFTRTVKINNNLNGGDEAKIDVTMSWTGKYGIKSLKLQENIFNLQ